MFNLGFPSDPDDVKFRAVQWICTEVMLAAACIWCILPRTWTPHPRFLFLFFCSVSG